MQAVSIIIPNYNGRDGLQACIASIKAHTRAPHEIIVIDNGSNDGSLELCRQERVKLISLPSNRGFPAACNFGLRLAVGDTLLLLNNDTIVTPGWLDNMMRCLYSGEDVGIVGPMTKYASGKQQMAHPYPADGHTAAMENVPDDAKWHEVQRIAGFGFLFKREVLERVGLLDDLFALGHFEDDDYCYRTRQAGYRLFIAGDVFIYHQASGSLSQEPHTGSDLSIQDNYQAFIQKWGVDPLSSI